MTSTLMVGLSDVRLTNTPAARSRVKADATVNRPARAITIKRKGLRRSSLERCFDGFVAILEKFRRVVPIKPKHHASHYEVFVILLFDDIKAAVV